MTLRTQILRDLLTRLRSSVGASVSLHALASQEDTLTIQVGDKADAIVGVEISDALRPSFRISYPKLSIKKNGDRHVSTVTSDRVLADGVTWVIVELARHGVVTPEFSH